MAELILCGRGGQGIVFLTRLLGDIASAKGLDVISSETHGMAVRGGSINSHLRIGSFSSPLIRNGHADFLLSLDATETGNNKHYLKGTGVIVENSPLPCENTVLRVDASRLAREFGRVQLENVVLLGFACTIEGFPIGLDDVKERLALHPNERVRAMNLIALDAGSKAVAAQQC